MGIYIRSMEMPTSCAECLNVGLWNVFECHLDDVEQGKRPDCPLIEIPDKHGRLIDADAFDERVRIAGGMADEEMSDDFKDGIQATLLLLKSQRTIISAEPEEE